MGLRGLLGSKVAEHFAEEFEDRVPRFPVVLLSRKFRIFAQADHDLVTLFVATGCDDNPIIARLQIEELALAVPGFSLLDLLTPRRPESERPLVHFALSARAQHGPFDSIQPWKFDDDRDLGNYNTQQHWVTHSGGLFLVYTRRGANNNHVFRHRVPLFMAQVDPTRLRVVRETDKRRSPWRRSSTATSGRACC